MLVMTYYDVDIEAYVEKEVHLGNGRLSALMPNNGLLTEIQADGDELEKIRKEFTNIPMHNGRVVRWSDDTLNFIKDNLVL